MVIGHRHSLAFIPSSSFAINRHPMIRNTLNFIITLWNNGIHRLATITIPDTDLQSSFIPVFWSWPTTRTRRISTHKPKLNETPKLYDINLFCPPLI